jgi:hypothetical protein
MSILRCDSCSRPIDTDDDPECINDDGYSLGLPVIVLCEPCRERAWDEQEERKTEEAA